MGGHQKITSVNTALLSDLTASEPDYGATVRAIPLTSPSDVKYIRITDFDEYGIPEDHEFVTGEVVDEKYLLENNDVLFARSGATVGKTFIYDDRIGKAIFAGYCIRFKFNTDKVNPKFVYYYTKTYRYYDWVRAIQRPAGQPNINKEEFKSFSIPLPSRKKQEDLVDQMESANTNRDKKLSRARALLDEIDRFVLEQLSLQKIEMNNRWIFGTKLREVKNSSHLDSDYFHPERIAAMKSIGGNSEHIQHYHLVDLVKFVRDISSVDSQEVYIGLANIQSNTGELVNADENNEISGSAFVFQENDVLYGRLRPYLNKVYRAEMSGKCSTEFHVMRVVDKNLVKPTYLASILRSSIILGQTRHMMTGNTHPRIANDDVINLVIPIPDIEVQETIVVEESRRRLEARRLREEAKNEWDAAKEKFEESLLGEAEP